MAWAIYISFAGALISALLPKAKPGLARWWALAVSMAGLAIGLTGFAAAMGQGRQVFVDVLWVPSMGIHFLLAADGISRVLVLLTGIASVASRPTAFSIASWVRRMSADGRSILLITGMISSP